MARIYRAPPSASQARATLNRSQTPRHTEVTAGQATARVYWAGGPQANRRALSTQVAAAPMTDLGLRNLLRQSVRNLAWTDQAIGDFLMRRGVAPAALTQMSALDRVALAVELADASPASGTTNISTQILYHQLGEHLLTKPADVAVLDQCRNIEVHGILGQMTVYYNAMVQPLDHITALESLGDFTAAAATIQRHPGSDDALTDLHIAIGRGALEFATTQPPPSGDDTSEDERQSTSSGDDISPRVYRHFRSEIVRA
jgi:hypothetical protein